MKSARAWKRFYAEERAALGDAGLDALLDRAPEIDHPRGGALVFPHVHLAVGGPLVAAVARAVVRSGAREVLAIGVLHGARGEDAELVARARAGDAGALARLRRVHGEGTADDGGHCAEEYSLEGFAALLARAAAREGRPAPSLVLRYPFMVGDADPASLAGFAELEALRDRGAAIVGTTDPVHHGAGYDTPEIDQRAREAPETLSWARAHVEAQLAALVRGDWAAFQREASAVRSDFRDVGPTLARLLRPKRSRVVALDLADYAKTLAAPEPTWVASALLELTA